MADLLDKIEKNHKKQNPQAYSAKDIEVLEGLEPVRRRPGMYIGGTDDKALHHLAAEILDNAMDEVVAGFANRIEVHLSKTGYLTIKDNGRGIPTEIHEKTGKSANSDLLQGKVTLLVSKIMEIGTEDQKNKVMKVWGKLEAKTEDIENAKKAIRESGAYKYSVEVAKGYAMRASKIVAELHGKNLNEEAVNYLEGIALYMVEREV